MAEHNIQNEAFKAYRLVPQTIDEKRAEVANDYIGERQAEIDALTLDMSSRRVFTFKADTWRKKEETSSGLYGYYSATTPTGLRLIMYAKDYTLANGKVFSIAEHGIEVGHSYGVIVTAIREEQEEAVVEPVEDRRQTGEPSKFSPAAHLRDMLMIRAKEDTRKNIPVRIPVAVVVRKVAPEYLLVDIQGVGLIGKMPLSQWSKRAPHSLVGIVNVGDCLNMDVIKVERTRKYVYTAEDGSKQTLDAPSSDESKSLVRKFYTARFTLSHKAYAKEAAQENYNSALRSLRIGDTKEVVVEDVIPSQTRFRGYIPFPNMEPESIYVKGVWSSRRCPFIPSAGDRILAVVRKIEKDGTVVVRAYRKMYVESDYREPQEIKEDVGGEVDG